MLDLYKNKNKYIFLFVNFLFFIFFISVASALQDDLTFQVNKQFDLKRPCFDRGFFCDNNFNCNITLIYPDSSILVNNQQMTNNISFRNITITQEQNNQLGFISAIQSCNNQTNAGPDTYDITITADGSRFKEFPDQYIIIILAIVFIIVGILNERLRMFKHIGSLILMVMGVITLYPGFNFINWQTLMGKSLGFSLIALGFFFLIEDTFSRESQDDSYDQETEGGYYED